MKTKLLLAFAFLSTISFAQSSITSFFGTTNFDYTNLNASPALSHSVTGANVTWNFTNVPTNGTSMETNSTPSPSEITTFPGTTTIHNVTTVAPSPSNDAKIYCKNSAANVFSFTGFDANGIILNYNTNNAIIGTFPLAFNYANTDTSAGTFIYTTYNGTFTGTIATNYDSYGTLNLSVDGFAPISVEASRVKVVQNINLAYSFFGTIGTIVQTTYTYYVNDGGTIKPYFRDTTYVINVPLLSIDQTTNQAQIVTSALINLSASDFDTNKSSIRFYPNPASSYLNIENSSNEQIKSISVIDTNGRVILQTENTTEKINIQNLTNGVYIIHFETNTSIETQKFIKE